MKETLIELGLRNDIQLGENHVHKTRSVGVFLEKRAPAEVGVLSSVCSLLFCALLFLDCTCL